MAKRLKPQFIYTTYSGTLYSLTSENQKDLGINNVHFVLGDLWRMKEVFNKLPEHMSAKDFYNMRDMNIYLSPVLFEAKKTRGCDKNDSIEIDCYGYKKVSNAEYLTLSSALKPDLLATLTEEPRDDTSGKKSMKRNIKKSLVFLKETIDFKAANKTSWEILSSFQGGLDIELRKEHLEKMKEFVEGIDGVVLYGLFESSPELLDAQKQVLRSEIYSLAREAFTDKKIVLSSDGDYLKVLEGWRNGVSHFEANYPFKLSREGKATQVNPSNWLKHLENFNKISYAIEDTEIDTIFQRQNTLYTIDLNDSKFEKDLTPLDLNCGCYACKNFTRSYISHLLRHKEMLANVLLTIHNCFAYKEFFEVLGSDSVSQNANCAIKAFWILFTDSYNIKSNSGN